ncbi:MAG: HpcH/HpaI aldolase/citrate lyase family protein [Burkholderiales bacterium]|nr:HpcH/HpaI aldolase/citrate lyase family protein [Burkholderiales bacterium]
MDPHVNPFKRALASGRTLFGAWLMSGAASTAEALGVAGFDFLVVDMEHTPLETHHMIDMLRAVAGTRASPIVRLPWNDMVMIKRALDGGAQSLLMPFVQDAEEARRAVSYTRYPPQGVRGVAGMHRGNRYGTVPDYFKAGDQELCVMVQIETAAALARLAEIAAVPGIDSIFIGPADLSASMGHLGDSANAEVQNALRGAARQCRDLGKPVGIIGTNPDLVARYVEYGYHWIAIGSDMAFMMSRAQEWLARARGLAPPESATKPGAY